MHKKYPIILILCMVTTFTLSNHTSIQAQAQYSGSLKLPGLSKEVEVYFDKHGIPHVYAQSERDTYFTLGYLHAQERLGQLEFYRKLATGRFSEIIGKAGIATDKLIRTSGIVANAKRSAKLLREGANTRFKTVMLAYLAGLNAFVETGATPREFELLGMQKEKFTLEDVYAYAGFLSFQLALGFRSELVINQIRQKLGDKYLKDLEYRFGTPITPSSLGNLHKGDSKKTQNFRGYVVPEPKNNLSNQALDKNVLTQKLGANIRSIVGVATWLGSNAWVLSGKKTRKGKVIFSNDTHLGVAQPGFWYEVHLNFPGESLYGYVHPLTPGFILGHNKNISFGNTSLLVDDMDFYQEKYKPNSHYQIEQDGKWENLTIRQETIKVKGGEDVKFIVRSTRRGPIINDVLPEFTKDAKPISMFWVYNKFPNQMIESAYNLSIAQNLKEAEKAASGNISPSFNVMYGDKAGNIAWWAGARIIKRQAGVNSKFLLDGSKSSNEPLGYYKFSENPKSINPASGYVTTANNQPDKVDGKLYPGFYVAGVRQRRLMDMFNKNKKWSNTELKDLFMDDVSPLFVKISKEVLEVIKGDAVLSKSPNHAYAARLLKGWKGGHGLKEKAPVVFSKLLYYLVKNTMGDELGNTLLKELMPASGFMNEILSRTYPVLFFKNKSVWWNDISTNDRSESRKEIFVRSYDQTIQELSTQLPNTNDWRWGKVHQITYTHFTKNKSFNIGSFPVSGGMDVINKFGFALSSNKIHQVSDQPSQRMLVDFSDKERKTFGILPVGNSGNPKSIFYKDQVEMYNKGKLRRQLTNKKEIQSSGSLLRLKVK